MIITHTYQLPTYAATYLLHGDASGLTNEEQAEIDQWTDANTVGWCVDVRDDTEFTRTNDMNDIAGDVCTIIFQRYEIA